MKNNIGISHFHLFILICTLLSAYVLGLITYRNDLFPLNIYRDVFREDTNTQVKPVATSQDIKTDIVLEDKNIADGLALARNEINYAAAIEVESCQPLTKAQYDIIHRGHLIRNLRYCLDATAYDFSLDPIGSVYYKKITPVLETALSSFATKRIYSSNSFPLNKMDFETFQKSLRISFYENINVNGYRWEEDQDISQNYTTELLKVLEYKNFNLNLYKIHIFATQDDIPVVTCSPSTSSEETTPGIILFSGHTAESGVFDLMLDTKSYQRAMARRLCQEGFITLAVEKLDSGYTSVRFQKLGKKNVVEREPGGGGDDELEVATTVLSTGDLSIFARQTIANLSAYDFFRNSPSLRLGHIGAAGVSFGGWQALHLVLLRSEIKAVSNFSGMWSYLEKYVDDGRIENFEGVNDFSQSFPGLFLLGDQNRYVLAVAGVPMQMAHGINDWPYTDYKKYYIPIVREQYALLGKEHLLETLAHCDPLSEQQYLALRKGHLIRRMKFCGQHSFSPADVVSYFRRTLIK